MDSYLSQWCLRGGRRSTLSANQPPVVGDTSVFGWQRFRSGGDISGDTLATTSGGEGSGGDNSSVISWNRQHMLVFCGLRGAMAFSLAIRNTSTDVRQMFFSTTIIVVIITVLLGGCLATPLLQWLKIP